MIAVRGLCVQTVCVTVADMRRDTKKMAFAAVATALSAVLLFLSSALSNMSLSILAVSGIVSAISLAECGYKFTFLQYLAVSIISAVFVPDKSCVVLYVVLFGHYPILKIFIERVGKAWLQWIIKLALANMLAFFALYVTLTFLENVGNIIIMGKKYFFVFYNIAVVLYDIFIGKCMFFYRTKRFAKGRFN